MYLKYRYISISLAKQNKTKKHANISKCKSGLNFAKSLMSHHNKMRIAAQTRTLRAILLKTFLYLSNLLVQATTKQIKKKHTQVILNTQTDN